MAGRPQGLLVCWLQIAVVDMGGLTGYLYSNQKG